MSLWAKASSVLHPLTANKEKEKEDNKIEEIVEISESKLGTGRQDDKSIKDSSIT